MSNSKPRLVVRRGPNPDQVYTLTSAMTFVGRELVNEVVIADAEVSRRHARIFWEEGTFYIEDLHSTNGTYVNGRRVTEKTRLASGDILDFGETIRVIFEHDIASAVVLESAGDSPAGQTGPLPSGDASQLETLTPYPGDRATSRPMRPTLLHRSDEGDGPPRSPAAESTPRVISTDMTRSRPSVSKSWYVIMGIAFFLAVLVSCLALFYYLNTNYPNLFF